LTAKGGRADSDPSLCFSGHIPLYSFQFCWPVLSTFVLPVIRASDPLPSRHPAPLAPAGKGHSCLQSVFSPFSSQMGKISSYSADRSTLGCPSKSQLLCLPGSFLVMKGCCDRGARALLLLVFATAPTQEFPMAAGAGPSLLHSRRVWRGSSGRWIHAPSPGAPRNLV